MEYINAKIQKCHPSARVFEVFLIVLDGAQGETRWGGEIANQSVLIVSQVRALGVFSRRRRRRRLDLENGARRNIFSAQKVPSSDGIL